MIDDDKLVFPELLYDSVRKQYRATGAFSFMSRSLHFNKVTTEAVLATSQWQNAIFKMPINLIRVSLSYFAVCVIIFALGAPILNLVKLPFQFLYGSNLENILDSQFFTSWLLDDAYISWPKHLAAFLLSGFGIFAILTPILVFSIYLSNAEWLKQLGELNAVRKDSFLIDHSDFYWVSAIMLGLSGLLGCALILFSTATLNLLENFFLSMDLGILADIGVFSFHFDIRVAALMCVSIIFLIWCGGCQSVLNLVSHCDEASPDSYSPLGSMPPFLFFGIISLPILSSTVTRLLVEGALEGRGTEPFQAAADFVADFSNGLSVTASLCVVLLVRLCFIMQPSSPKSSDAQSSIVLASGRFLLWLLQVLCSTTAVGILLFLVYCIELVFDFDTRVIFYLVAFASIAFPLEVFFRVRRQMSLFVRQQNVLVGY